MNKVICIGECLVDFLPNGDRSYKANAGGAPANVCACVSRLGGKGCYLGKFSTDVFSKFLISELEECGVSCDLCVKDEKYPTALAFVTLDNGEREFSFYHTKTSDTMLDVQDIPAYVFSVGDMLHFCSVGLACEPTRSAHSRAIELALTKGAKVSFDLNFRPALWNSIDNMLAVSQQFAARAHLIKASDDELSLLYSGCCERDAVDRLFALSPSAEAIIITRGAKGCAVYDRTGGYYERAAIETQVVDTTGAGDCFIGSVLYQLVYKDATLSAAGLTNAVGFASAAASIVISQKGAMHAMPSYQQVMRILDNH